MYFVMFLLLLWLVNIIFEIIVPLISLNLVHALFFLYSLSTLFFFPPGSGRGYSMTFEDLAYRSHFTSRAFWSYYFIFRTLVLEFCFYDIEFIILIFCFVTLFYLCLLVSQSLIIMHI